MPRLTLGTPRAERRPLNAVMPGTNDGPSPRGSTYYKTMLNCPREWALKYAAGIETEQLSLALTIGLLYHLCLEAYYRELMCKPKQPGNAVTTAYSKLDPFRSESGYMDIIDIVDRQLAGYFHRYEQEDASWNILAVEETLIYTGPFTYSARVDLIIEDYVGMWIVEHKTAQSLNETVLAGYQLDLQVLGQVWLAQNCLDLTKLPAFRGVKINVATKHKAPQFTRLEVCPSQWHLNAFERSIDSWDTMRDHLAELDYPQSLGHCSGYSRGYGRCDFYNLCHGHPSVSVKEWCEAADNQLPVGYKKKDR